MSPDPTDSADAGCPACRGRLRRAPRRLLERLPAELAGRRRYRCTAVGCDWSGLLLRRSRAEPTPVTAPTAAAPAATTTPARRRDWRPAVWLLAGALAAGAATWTTRHPAAEPAVRVGPHLVVPGTHLDGDRLPAAHPLRERVPSALLEDEPSAYAESEEARLRVRRHCAWGLPGRDPYRGSIEQALQTAQLSPTVVRRIASDIRAGRRSDRVVIANQAIRAVASGREFDPRRVAMTHGMTLCVDTRVNFARGHREGADLFEAMDEDGRIYAVMVPEVCGNVSVLGERAERDADGRLKPQPLPLAEVLQRPPEQRPRELPAALLAVSGAGADGRDSDDGGAHPVSAPGTMALVGLALALAAWTGRRRRRR